MASSSCPTVCGTKWVKRRRLLRAIFWLGVCIAGNSCLHYLTLGLVQGCADFIWPSGSKGGLDVSLLVSVLIDTLPIVGGWLGDVRISKFKLLAIGSVLYTVGCTCVLMSGLHFGAVEAKDALKTTLLVLGLLVFAAAALCTRAVAPALLLQQLKRQYCCSIFNCVTWYYCCLNLGSLASNAALYGSAPYVDSRKLAPLIFASAALAFAGLACGLAWIREYPPSNYSAVRTELRCPLVQLRRLRLAVSPSARQSSAAADDVHGDDDGAEWSGPTTVEQDDPDAQLFRYCLLVALAVWVAVYTQMTACLDAQLRLMHSTLHRLFWLCDPGCVFLLAPLLCWASSRYYKLHHMAWRFGIGQLVICASALVAALCELVRDKDAYQPAIVLPSYLLMALSEILVIVSGYEILALLTQPCSLGFTIGLCILFFSVGRAMSVGFGGVFIARGWINSANSDSDQLQMCFIMLCTVQLLSLTLYALLWLRLGPTLTAPLHRLSDSLLGWRQLPAGREQQQQQQLANSTAVSSYDDSSSDDQSSMAGRDEFNWRESGGSGGAVVHLQVAADVHI